MSGSLYLTSMLFFIFQSLISHGAPLECPRGSARERASPARQSVARGQNFNNLTSQTSAAWLSLWGPLWLLDRPHDSRSPSGILCTFIFLQSVCKGMPTGSMRPFVCSSHVFNTHSLLFGLGKLSDTGRVKSSVVRQPWV